MSEFSGSWRVAIRAGRRDLRRSKGRSALVALMVGTPVLLTVMLSTLIASNSVSQREGIPDEMGSAEASANYVNGPAKQTPDASNYSSTDASSELTRPQQITALGKVAGGAVSVVQRGYGATVVIGSRGYGSTLLAADARQHAAAGMVKMSRGRVPRAADEVVVTPALEQHGATIGSRIDIDGTRPRTVVGIGQIGVVEHSPGKLAVLGLPDSFGEMSESSYLIDTTHPVRWSDVKRINKAGFVVLSRDVLNHPPRDSELYPDTNGLSSASDGTDRAILALVVTSVLLEVVLLAGPAFAVGVRRQRRDLALLAATGASPKQIRRVVLGQALVLGVLSCLISAALGVGLSALVLRFGPDLVPKATFGPFEVRWPQVVAPVVLGAVAALLAAYVPARQACRQEVAAVLAGRRGAIRSSRGWPVVGLVLVLGALVLCFTRGTRPGGEIAVATSTVGLVLGTVLLTPLVIGTVAMLGARLPLSLRLAVRDTARQRARSAPAIAAVMASVAAITTLAIASSSDFEQSRREYIYQSSPGRMVLSAQTDELADVIRAASKATHNVKFTTLATAGKYVEDGMSIDVSMKNSDAYDGQNGVVVADAATVDEWGASLDANARRELSRGGIVVYNKSLIVDGKATMLIQGDQEKSIRLPAVVGDLGTGPVPQNEEPQLAGAVISPATAAARHIPSMTTTAVSDRTAAISRADEKAADEAVKGIDPVNGGTYVERGFHESYRLPFLALLGFGILAVLIGTMTATGLALSDARPDFSTLAAIGAAPRTRRRVAGAQAIVLATLGSLLGIAVGFAPGLAATWPLTAQSYIGGVEKVGSPIIAIPWMLLGVIAIAVPMVAAVAAMAFTRSKLVVVRRLAQ